MLSVNVSLSAEEAILAAVVRGGRVIVSAALSGFESDQSYSSFRKGLLEEGLKAEISYQFRLYKRNKSFFSFLGDKVITEKKITKTAYLDIYERVFVVEVNEVKRVLLYVREKRWGSKVSGGSIFQSPDDVVYIVGMSPIPGG